MTGEVISFPKPVWGVSPAMAVRPSCVDVAILARLAGALLMLEDKLVRLSGTLSMYQVTIAAQRLQNEDVIRAIEREDVVEMERLYKSLTQARHARSRRDR